MAFTLTFRDLTAGDGTDIQIDNMEGLEGLPGLDGENHPLAGLHGSVPGIWLARDRVITCEYAISAGTATGIRTALNALRSAMQPTEAEHPLVIDLPELGEVLLFARSTGRTIPSTAALTGRGTVAGILQWVASDPRIYSTTLRTLVIPVFVGSGGLEYPVDYPKDYGSVGVGLTTEVPNDGDFDTWPRITITGPSSGTVTPLKIENTTDGTEVSFTAGGGLTIPAGSTLVVDTHPARRVVRFTDGANRWHTVAGTTWWPIHPGGAQLRFRATGNTTGVTCTVETRDAYL